MSLGSFESYGKSLTFGNQLGSFGAIDAEKIRQADELDAKVVNLLNQANAIEANIKAGIFPQTQLVEVGNLRRQAAALKQQATKLRSEASYTSGAEVVGGISSILGALTPVLNTLMPALLPSATAAAPIKRTEFVVDQPQQGSDTTMIIAIVGGLLLIIVVFMMMQR